MEKEMVKQRVNAKEYHEFKFNQQLAQLNKLFDDEKQELYTEMRILKKNADEFAKMKDMNEIRFFYQKWLFIAAVKKLQGLGNLRDQ